jgi:ubiquinone/menaquinone biosynthesis C-methylase UbiE
VEVIDDAAMSETSTQTRPPLGDGGARTFFDGYAADFDHIYDDTGKGAVARFIDTRLRKEMRIRFSNTFTALEPLAGRSLLDAGCGGGRYAIPAAKAGATRVLGLDFSEPMLELGRRKAAAEGVGAACEFVNGDLLTYPIAEKSFDYAIAIGFFDYQADALTALRALVRAARRRVFVSLPKRWHVLTPQRKVRYTLFKCFVRFYSRAEVDALIAAVAPRHATILDIGREYNLRLDFE